MIPFPSELEPYRDAATEFLASGYKPDLEFNRETYQIAFSDPQTKEEEWVFLQFDEKGGLNDHFCSCEEAEEKGCCLHQAMALLTIGNGQATPLHARFHRSLWRVLSEIGLRRYGDDEGDLLWKGDEIWFDPKKKKEFFLSIKTKEAGDAIRSMIENRPVATEENSIKFSNLSEEELEAWQRGMPTFRLQYDLSYWSDLGKWWMSLQEKECSIEFFYDNQKIPIGLRAKLPEVTIECSLSMEELLEVIPTLVTVPSPLQVRQERISRLQSIEYDRKKAQFRLKMRSGKEEKRLEEDHGIPMGSWIYLPEEGFIHTVEPEWMQQDRIPTSEVPQMLTENFDLVERFLEGTAVHRTKRTAQYEVYFDDQWNLHLDLYLFKSGDLNPPGVQDFGNWFFLPEKGFFPIEGRLFPQIKTVVPEYHVGEFIRHHRSWFAQRSGYQTFLSAIEGHINYSMSETGWLSFSRVLKKQRDTSITKDFGSYLYVEGEGFYPKGLRGNGTAIRPGISISPEQIPLFLQANREELEAIPEFFSEKCPVMASSLRFDKIGEEEIEVVPHYTLSPGYEERQLQFFDEFVYTPDEGFCELKGSLRLPEPFRHRFPVPTRKIVSFFQETLPKIEELIDWIHPHLRVPESLSLTAQSLVKGTEGKMDHYSGSFSYESEIGNIPLITLWTGFKKKKRYLFTSAGRIDLHDRRFSWIKRIPEEQIQLRRNLLSLTPLQFIRLHALEKIRVVTADEEQEKESLTFLHEITHFVTPLPPDQKGFLSHLRPYQQTGLQWLWFLYQYSLSGLLCDEMGLGKTHQAMGLIASVVNDHSKKKRKNPQFLVICPTSVLYHWKEKIEEYLPSFKVFTFYGTKRTLDEFTPQHQILLTSYGIWRNERERLQEIPFEVAFFDEIQVAKNAQSRIYHALKAAQARTKIGLTGTPIENHLRELKTLFDLVLPSYMPNDKEYREIFVKPIEKEGSKEKKDLLTQFINPFIIRRRKRDVLVDLPEKIEEISHCDLIAEQDRLYRDVLMQGRQQILPQLEDGANPIPYVHIFSLLTHLKQICDHPAVYWKQPDEFTHHSSGKWELFKELLNEALESEQKVVVYSQYLHMLDIIEMYLEELNVSYATLRGATTNRGEQIARFHKDPSCRVFVGSLHAAGLGIDLTPASVVFHYDRWWNAAKENQATDRVHRIGQTRGVQVFKLVTLNTFEERIDELIKKKQKLLEEVVGVDDKDMIKTFSRDEILKLLDYVEKEEITTLVESEED